jgi:hypothetical protein
MKTIFCVLLLGLFAATCMCLRTFTVVGGYQRLQSLSLGSVSLETHKDSKPTPVQKGWKKIDEPKGSFGTSRDRPVQLRPANSGSPGRNTRKNIPWWNSANEDNNPRLLNRYRPWWMENNFAIEDRSDSKSWTVPELREEAKRRGLPLQGKKAELIERINQSYLRYRLTDDNFSSPTYDTEPPQIRMKCYPEVYE